MKAAQNFVGILTLVVALCLAGSAHTADKTSGPKPEVAWVGYGKPGVDTISVIITGDVKYPGRYYLAGGASLDSVYFAFGGWGGHGDLVGTPPHKVSITRQVDAAKKVKWYGISKMSREEKTAVRLEDGDWLEYPTVIF